MQDRDYYNKMERDINQKLSTGVSREETSKEFGYKTWKSLDVFMRRRGFSWNAEKNVYMKNDTSLASKRVEAALMPERAKKVIELFRDGIGDAKAVAEKNGFSDPRAMAEYMRENGFIWSIAEKNYIYQRAQKNVAANSEEATETMPVLSLVPASDQGAMPAGFEKYIPILEFIQKHQDKIVTLIQDVTESSRISKYSVPGSTKTKSFYMSDKLSTLVNEFSEIKNLTQREIVESALVEYLKKYGFGNEIERLMKAA